MTYGDIDELCTREIEERSDQLWRSFAVLYAGMGMLTHEHVDEIKQMVRDYLPQILKEVEEPLMTHSMVCGKGWNDLVSRAPRNAPSQPPGAWPLALL
jgi:hypothetical protein